MVDNLKNSAKFINLIDLDIADYIDKKDFIASIMAGDNIGDIQAIFMKALVHQLLTGMVSI